ncbi:MAG: CvpA family protein [Bacteroidales bacterium]|nr:CvpA family protein [Bacteroidales bacterium]MBD5172545.1 CvpA family protein [Bacteroidales bacterium]
MEIIFHLVAIVVVAVSVLLGFRKGLLRQLPSVIALAFGIVATHIFLFPVADAVYSIFISVHGKCYENFFCTTIAAALIFFFVYGVFGSILRFIGKALSKVRTGILDNIVGSLFLLFKWVMMLSLFYNLLMCWQQDSVLLNAMKSDDGNAVEEVMLVAPAVLGSESPEELRHRIQLQEASRIS